VFTPKYRRDVFVSDMLSRLQFVFKETCEQMGGELIEFGCEDNHLHLMVTIPPSKSISNFVGKLKGKSSYILRHEFWDEIKDKLWGDQFWSPSYCVASCGGAPLDIVKAYVENQNKPPSAISVKRSIATKGDNNPKRITR
jgi:putative transposase